ncbi:hypothetical protein [Nocardia sp. NPDC059691]|uniref:hypothetical protein n=1 Tax=Nocardia sp. NPDC059691 TaxID=3346908 RepID=UPI0036861DDE
MSMLLSALFAVLLGLAPPAAQFKVAPGDVQTIPGAVSPHVDRDQDLDCATTGNLVCSPALSAHAWGAQ